jgi:hypothetical protein
LKQVLTEANKNGQVVILSLFDHDNFRTLDGYFVNPWNPFNNNIGVNCNLPNDSDRTVIAATQFYNICNQPDGGVCPNISPTNTHQDLTCLGKVQRNLVNKIVDIVKAGNTNSTPFKNVIFELANEAVRFDGANTPPDWTVSTNVYKTWYATVAQWIRDKGKYIIVINPGPEAYQSDNSEKYLFDCTTSCTNQYSVMNNANIHILSLHGGAWKDFPENSSLQYDPCKLANKAIAVFKKPVMIDDDSTLNARNNNTNVGTWSARTANCTVSGVSDAVGLLHYDHLEEGQHLQTTATCNPTVETANIDCASYNILGDISPFSDLCAISGTCPSLTETTQYCIQKGCYQQ